MKTKIINNIALAVSLLVAFSSCQKGENDVFDSNVSTRVDGSIADIKDVLTQSENGWYLHYFSVYGVPSVMTLSFTDDKVSVSGEKAPNKIETSYYKINANDGVSLRFDTYNSILHADATPSHSRYQGLKGDFDFVVKSYCADSVILEGVRWRNICRMYPLKESSRSYLKKVDETGRSFNMTTVVGKMGNGDVVAYFDKDYKEFYIGGLCDEDKAFEVASYVYTDNGIQLQKPLEYNGEVIFKISYDQEKNQMQLGHSVFEGVVSE